MMQFRYVNGYNAPVSADLAGKELERIRRENDGELKSAAVVDESRPENAPLHPVFEWCDSVAAEEYRKQQARRLIRGIKVVHESRKGPHESRMYVNIRTEDRQHYVPAVEAMSDKDMRAQVLGKLHVMLMHYEQQIAELRGLSGIRKGLKSLIAEIERAA